MPLAGTHQDADRHARKIKLLADGVHQLPTGALGQLIGARECRKRWRARLHLSEDTAAQI